MRELTIIRQKSAVGCIGKIKIYVEDHVNMEMIINDVPCKKIGELKNNQQATFVITEDSVKLFVIYDAISKDRCNEMVSLSAGSDAITLSGKPHFNPAAGNPFRFEGVTDQETLANRKKGGKLGVVVLIVSLVVGFIVGWAIAPSLFGG